ncbi:SpoIIE family protein phosphatase [Nocardioidaceae bacterium]|nr:SpoIIE family protein phosphatase [Nocardioidaceae bacterium]
MREPPTPAPPGVGGRGAPGARPAVELHLAPTLLVSLLLAALVAVAAGATWQPRGSIAVVLLTAPPLCALVAVAVVGSCARAFGDPRLGWFAVGLGVAASALCMMLLSRELVEVAGTLGAASDAQAALTLTSHLSLAVGVVLEALRLPMRLLPVVLTAGIVGSAVLVSGVVPLPALFDGLAITPLMRGLAVAVALVTLGVTAAWVRPRARLTSGLHGWAAVALVLSALGLLVLAAADEVYSHLWWAGLTLRTSTYVVLAAGSLWWLIASLVSGEIWTRRELSRRDGELEVADGLSRRLLDAARELSEALTVPDVCETASRLAVSGTRALDAHVVPAARDVSGAATPGLPTYARQLVDRHGGSEPLHAPVFSDPVGLVADDDGPGTGRAYAVLALRAEDRLLGHLVLVAETGRTWTPYDVRFLTALVDQTALALSRGRAYETVAAASATLQASIRPGRPTAVAGLTLHAVYRPVTVGHEVGGDWFDTIAVDEDRVVLVVGDVMGKGWRAAAVMGQARTALRTAASLHLDPGAALDMLDTGIVDLRPDEIITVVYALVDRRRGEVGIARAGHPPGLLIDADGRAGFVEHGGSPPIGLVSGPRSEHWVPIEEVAGLVLYTDGVVESRAKDLDQGMQALARRAETVAEEARRLGDEGAWETWLEELHARADWQDDVAVLVACLGPAGPPGGAQAGTLPGLRAAGA